jgi:hypothetical protein
MGQLYWWCKGELNAIRIIPCVAHGDYTHRFTEAHRRNRTDGDFSEYVGALAIDTPRALIPLQTADLLAYEFYHLWIDTEFPSDPDRMKDRPASQAIERNESAMRGACYFGNGVRLAVERRVEMKERQRR